MASWMGLRLLMRNGPVWMSLRKAWKTGILAWIPSKEKANLQPGSHHWLIATLSQTWSYRWDEGRWNGGWVDIWPLSWGLQSKGSQGIRLAGQPSTTELYPQVLSWGRYRSTHGTFWQSGESMILWHLWPPQPPLCPDTEMEDPYIPGYTLWVLSMLSWSLGVHR